MSAETSEATRGEEARVFARAYVANGFRRKAAALAMGVSEDIAIRKAYQWSCTEAFQTEFSRIMARQRRSFAITTQRVLEELSYIAFFDIGEIYNENGSMKSLTDMDPKARRAIVGLESAEEMCYNHATQENEYIGSTKKVKLASKEKALELLAKHLGILTEKIEIGGGETPIQYQNVPAEEIESRIKRLVAQQVEEKLADALL